MTLDPGFLELLACPQCKGELQYNEQAQTLTCLTCRLRFRIDHGIPVLLLSEAEPLDGGKPAEAEIREQA
jgi:uncharacterized protein YbaR (Trm112 family)